MRSTGVILCLIVVFAGVCQAQTFAGISGDVADSSGAVIPGASITVTNTGTNTARTTTTNEVGAYQVPSLVPGMYSVRAEAPGFQSQVRTSIQLQVQQLARIDFTLQLGEVTEVVEVSSTAALLNTMDATVGTVIEERRIVDLPLNGRNYLQLVALSPNVNAGFGTPGQASGRQGGSRTQQNISVAGMRGVWNNYTLDGIANTDVNFNLYIMQPSVDALQEFKVQSGVYPAEFGRSASQVNVSTKPGTNQYHGTVYWFHRNDALDAKQYDFDGTPDDNQPFRWNQYGFTLGGPVLKDRLFFMANFEGFKQRETGVGYWTTATTAMRTGDFSAVDYKGFKGLTDPLSGTPFAGNKIPQNRLDPTGTAQKLLEFWPVPNLPGHDRNYTQTSKDSEDKDQFTTRIDFHESSNSQWFGRFSWADEYGLNGGLPLSGSTLITTAKQYMVSNTRVLSPTKVNEFRFGFNTLYNEIGNELGGVRNVVEELGLPLKTEPPSSWGIPTIGIQSPWSGFGNSVNGPFVIDDQIYQINDNFSWVLGDHSLRFGGEYRYDVYDQIGNEFPRGRYSHDARFSGDGAADFLMGNLSRAEAALALAVADFAGSSFAFYVDDIYRVTPKLTLNFGLRYEFFQPYLDRSGTSVNSILDNGMCGNFPCITSIPNDPDPNTHSLAVRAGDGDFYEGRDFRYITNLSSIGGSAEAPIRYARDSSLYGSRLINNDWNNFAPRFGVAYSPNENWSFRTGVGLFYSAESGNSRFDMNRAMGGRLEANPTSDRPYIKWDNWLDPTRLPQVVGSPFMWGVRPDVGTTYSIMYLFNIQRSLGPNRSIEIGYNGAQHFNTQALQNQNAPIPGTTSILSRRPAPEFGTQQVVVGNNYGNYNGLGVKYTHRSDAGLTAMVSYTFSKSLDNSSAIRGTASDIFPQDSRCMDCEYGHSAFNVPHRFVTSLLYELPFGSGQRFLNQGRILDEIVGGWQIGSIVTLQNGRPINTAAGWDAPSTGTFGDPRMNATGEDPYLSDSQRSTEQWWNVGAFAYTPGGTFGNVARNRLIGPGDISWDFSVLKDFPIIEGHRLQFRFEAFNFPNHPNWGNPGASWGRNATVPQTGFGRIRSTGQMRQIQFGLKYIF